MSFAPTADVLAHIAAYKRVDVERRRDRRSLASLEAQAAMAPAPRPFVEAVARASAAGRPALIAEIKKASPSKGLIRADFDPPGLAKAYAEGGATCLSVLTDAPSFQGDDQHLVAAHDACALPMLRKDFLVDPWQVAEARVLGADAVLVILAMVDDPLAADLIRHAAHWRMDALVEVHDADEMARAIALGARLIGVNNRDLRTFNVDLGIFERLAPLAPAGVRLVAESGVATPADVARMARAGAHAILVGESLMRQDDVANAARQLLA